MTTGSANAMPTSQGARRSAWPMEKGLAIAGSRVRRDGGAAAPMRGPLAAATDHSSGFVSWTFGEIATTPLYAEPCTRKVEETPSPLRSPWATVEKPPVAGSTLEAVYWYWKY